MADIELVNESPNQFEDISSESYREYLFPYGETVRIEEPQYLAVSPSGGHRLLDFRGVSHYIPPRWIALQWKVKPGAPHFVK